MSRAEAEAILAEILQPQNAEAKSGRKIYTLAAFLSAIYLPVFRRKWKASTAMTEESRMEAHLVNDIGPRLMHEITREELQALLDRKAKTLGDSMVNHLRFRLRSVFELALAERVVDRNPATVLYTPRECQKGRARHVMTPEQANQMLEALDLRERLIARLATWEGMRPGEILALQIGDIDSESVWVRRRVYKGTLDTPKTKRSVRQVALTSGTVHLLETWLTFLPCREGKAWLFPTENPDSSIGRDNTWNRHMLPKLRAIGLEWATFQVMRRTFASLSKQIGVDAHTRSAQMGNSVDVNENEYAVTRFEDRLAAVRRLETTVVQ
jgi:integrase